MVARLTRRYGTHDLDLFQSDNVAEQGNVTGLRRAVLT
jgi:hypothetical protein